MSKRKLLKSFSFLFSLKNVEKSLGLVYLVDNLFSLFFFFNQSNNEILCIFFSFSFIFFVYFSNFLKK